MRGNGTGKKRVICFLLCALLCLNITADIKKPVMAQAAARIFYLNQAVSLTLSNSGQYRKKYNELLLKRIKYEEAVKSVQEKKRNLSTFRWTPLLSFKFPQKPNLTQEMEFIFKPLQIQYEISMLNHALTDIRQKDIQKARAAYTDVWLLQEKTAFTEEMLSNTQEDLERNRCRLALGKGTQADVDKLAKSVETLTSDLSQLLRNFETAKEVLSDAAGLDVTAGYRFENPMVTAKIDRHDLESITAYAIEHDQACYEAKLTKAAALENVKTAEQLMRSHYGGKVDCLNTYINRCKEGKEVDTAAFQMAYRQMLADVDRPWQGKIRILFIRIPKEWFKGQLDGIRYVEDEPYLLYTACLDLSSAAREEQDARKTLRGDIASYYETVVTAYNSYLSMRQNTEQSQKELDRLLALNRQGKASLEEVKEKQEDARQLQMDTMSALGDYSLFLYTFDQMTCGAVTPLLKGEGLDTKDTAGGDSQIPPEDKNEPYYYLEPQIENNLFLLGVHMPENYEPAATHFELWYDGIRIGERTPVNRTLRHLTIAARTEENLPAVLRFFDGDSYVGECEFDTAVPRDTLSFGTGPAKEEKEEEIGTWEAALNGVPETCRITLHLREETGIRYYRILDKRGEAVYSKAPLAAEESFVYLSILKEDFGSLRLAFYDRDQTLMYEGRLDTEGLKVLAERSGE